MKVSKVCRFAGLVLWALQSVSAYEYRVDDITWSYKVVHGEAEILGYREYSNIYGDYYAATKVVVPSVLQDHPVSAIDCGAFQWKGQLEDITIPEGVRRIGEEAFLGCSSLESVKLPSSLINIEASAFRDCGCLKKVELPLGLRDIGDCAFCCCNALAIQEIPEGVTNVGAQAFEYCSSLSSLRISASVERIGVGAFRGCGELRSVDLSTGLVEIGEEAFASCEKLQKVHVPASVQKIGRGGFRACTGLRKMTVDAGNIAFTMVDGCLYDQVEKILLTCLSGVESVVVPSDTIRIADNAFGANGSLRSVQIPEGVRSIGSYALGGAPI